MRHTRTWTDVYGSACASFEGRAGGHSWLVAAPPELAAGVPAALEALDAKGSVQLLVHDGVTPLMTALKEFNPRGVLVVASKALAAGPAVTVAERMVGDVTDMPYREGGEFPAWQGSLSGVSESGENAAASAASSLGFSVNVTDAASVQQALENWLDATPHGR